MKKLKSSRKNFVIRIISNTSPILLLLVALFGVSAVIAFGILHRQEPTPKIVTSSLGIRTISDSVSISAFVGAFRFTLAGFTSPGARVILEGQGIFDETYANDKGEFLFADIFSPLSPREACLTAIDTDGRTSNPLCLPPFPVNQDVSIGPVILPPTISTNQDQLLVDDFGILSGKGAPESDITIDLYPESKSDKITIATKTDKNGDYSLTLPTELSTTLRTYATNIYLGLFSDKSFTLTFSIMPIWKLMLRQLGMLLDFLKSLSLATILFIEALVILALILLGRKRKQHPLALRSHSIIGPIRPSNIVSRVLHPIRRFNSESKHYDRS